jgi:lipopolysaccharide/colanic/teichoic acid biosynthesis glycosyltransferase
MIRFLDALFSLVAIILLFPFMIPVMIALKCTGEHFVFFGQTRMGKGGKEFKVLKFATMLRDSPAMAGGCITQKDDPRVLPMGKFLRKTKINELPQLVNVLLGQMSLVGPRPLVADHLRHYSAEARDAVMTMRPGLTGIASLVFRDEEGILDRMPGDRKSNHDKVIAPYKGELELWFASQRSLRLYFSLIFRTAISVAIPGASLPPFGGLPEAPKELEGFLHL